MVCFMSPIRFSFGVSAGRVPELSIWMANVCLSVSFFRTPKSKRKLLHKENEKFLEFPKHFYVQFAEHTLNLLSAVLHKLKAAENLFQKMIPGTVTSERKELNMAQGFLSKWKGGPQKILPASRDI